MSKKFVDYDPLTGVTNYFHAMGDGSYVSEDVVDVMPTRETNKALFNDAPTRWKQDGYNHVASIPPTIWFELKRSGIADDEKALLKWIQDPDHSVFRTRPGRLV
jgi:hypothetical protein